MISCIIQSQDTNLEVDGLSTAHEVTSKIQNYNCSNLFEILEKHYFNSHLLLILNDLFWVEDLSMR